MAEKIQKPSLGDSLKNFVLGLVLAFLVSWLLSWLLSLVLRFPFKDTYEGICMIVRWVLTAIASLIFLIAVAKDFTEDSRAYDLAVKRGIRG